jgi:hypothetical protein
LQHNNLTKWRAALDSTKGAIAENIPCILEQADPGVRAEDKDEILV